MKLIFLFLSSFALLALKAGAQINIYYSPIKLKAGEHLFYAGMDPKNLAQDLADLLGRATGRPFVVLPYEPGQSKGIFLLLDSSIKEKNNECGIMETNGKDFVRIKAQYISGISYALYSWLEELGFKFYLPGNEWTTIPSLPSPFSDKVPSKKYQPYFIHRFFSKSGGVFALKNIDETLKNDKEWMDWYRRNRMGSNYVGIDGHMGEAFNIAHKEIIEQDPSLLAPVNGKRQYAVSGKLDPTNKKAVTLFSNWIAQKYLERKQQYANYLPFKKYYSVDAGDGLNYCHTPECEKQFKSVSDQAFFIANTVANNLKHLDSAAGVSTLAYTERADTPSFPIAQNIHVQMVASAFQKVTTPAQLMYRWSKKTNNLTQYDYINIGIWTADHPHFDLGNYFNYLQYVKKLGVQGFSFETSYSKFGSGIIQYFVLKFLRQPFASIDEQLEEFCNDNFGKAAPLIKKIFKEWYFSELHSDTQIGLSSFYEDELGRYFFLLDKASAIKDLPGTILQRITELKAYCIYLAKYYELRTSLKMEKLASINRNAYEDKAEALLQYTWSLYATKIFQNTQLNEALKNLFLKQPARKEKWNYLTHPNFGNLFQFQSAADAVNKEYRQIKKQYIPLASFNQELPPRFFENNYNRSADSIFIATADEKSLGYFMYAIDFYSPKDGVLTVACKTHSSAITQSAYCSVIAVEKNDFSYMNAQYIYRPNADSSINFRIPSAGFYKIYLAQYNATPIQFIIYPNHNLLFIHKKTTLFNFLKLQDFNPSSPYDNQYLSLYTPETDRLNYALINAKASNSFSFLFSNGIPANLNKTGSPYNLSVTIPAGQRNKMIYMNNRIFRYSAVLKNIPPYYFFMKKLRK